MPDLNHSITVHNETMAQWWKVPEYIKERKAFVLRNPVCARCGRPSTTPGHSHEDYRNFETYLNAVKTDKCDPLCSTCNMMERKGKKPCPICVEHKKEQIHYIGQYQETCFYCLPIEVQHAHEQKIVTFQMRVRKMRDGDNAARRAIYRSIKARRTTT